MWGFKIVAFSVQRNLFNCSARFLGMLFKEGAPLYAVQVEREQGESVLYVNYLGSSYVPSLAEQDEVRAGTIRALADNPEVSRVVFVQQKNYHYPSEQILLLAEIGRLYVYLTKQESLLSGEKLALFQYEGAFDELQYFLGMLQTDPLRCYSELREHIASLRAGLGQGISLAYVRYLERFLSLLEATKLIQGVLGKLDAGREKLYAGLFRPDVLPNFSFTRLVSQFPSESRFVDQYSVPVGSSSVVVTILQRESDFRYFYHILPPEYSLPEEHHLLLHLARNVLTEHRPKAEEFTDPDRTRQVFLNVARDLLGELSSSKGIALSYKELSILSEILVRYTIGFGLLEVLLADDRLQDIMLNAPIAQNSVFVRHSRYDECRTNIIPSFEDAESWAGKLRLVSGRPLDEAHPVLDTDIKVGGARARVAAITEPLSPQGLAYALRRHRDSPWTLPLFIEKKMINSFGAGLLSFLIDGSRTLLVAGTRSAGKTSLLGSLLLEIMPRYRVIVIEDTLELPVDALRGIGYNILRMKVRSALGSGTTEMEAAEGIRTSLRLGDSALIVGEVRSSEALALYEAMRVGALANVVAGTIHGDSPYGVFDRVVNDLKVPATSFKATDIIVVANPVRSADGLHSERRIMSITEVRKEWENDPLREGGFVDLMRYNVEKDELEPTQELMNGDSEIIKSIAGRVKGWAGNWDAVYDNIILRGRIKQELVDAAVSLGKPLLLEAGFNSISNAVFHRISEGVREEKGLPLGEWVFPKWKNWLYEAAGKL